MAAEKKLSKREKKAEAFKKRNKKQQFTEDMAVPASDVIDQDQPVEEKKIEEKKVEEKKKKQPDFKRKAAAIEVPTEGSQPKKNKKEAHQGSRYIVFVGNLPYATTKEDLEKHFESAGNIKSVRLLTDKATGKPKGFAFMEFENSKDLNKALAFHHTFFKKRQINVELTAGGGGKSEVRKEKLKTKNERLTEERKKKHEQLKNTNTQESSSYQIETPQE